ncbi:protein-disulfide reductase DsbD [Hydrocarboniphaga effusa]|uniref:protein-disulfide reductase DsbD n=1 Tax=Hydrocarboniphaga effusa TaxID=243629 RepID=UPI00398BC786
MYAQSFRVVSLWRYLQAALVAIGLWWLAPALAADAGAFLKPEQAFKYSLRIDGQTVVASWDIEPGYYLYRKRLSFSSPDNSIELGKQQWPAGEQHEDEFFGRQEVYRGHVAFALPFRATGDRSGGIPIEIKLQGCADKGLCFPPLTWRSTAGVSDAALPASASASASANGNGNGVVESTSEEIAYRESTVVVSEQGRLAELIRNGSLLAVLATFFGLGALLSLTPCVLPMIPILAGIIVGAKGASSPRRGLALAMTYVQGMALTYAIAGAISVMAIGQAPQAFFQNPWIVSAFAVLFVLLALAMFGFFTLQLPSSLQTRLTLASNRQRGGTYVGTFIMGGLSALVVTACVAPAVVAALAVIGQSGEVLRGAAALYASGLGMGLPLLVVGGSAGSLLPKAGAWMEAVKSVFGILFLALALYTAQGFLPAPIKMIAWSVLAIGSGLWGLSLRSRDQHFAPAPIRALALMSLLYGAMLLVGVGAGSSDPLLPLARFAGEPDARAERSGEPMFRSVKNEADLDREIAAAAAAGRSVMLDIYADWCVSCKEMERYTFSNPAVVGALRPFVLLKADVTSNDSEDSRLLKRFSVYGPPATIFFDRDGRELESFRIAGFVDAENFTRHVGAVHGKRLP